MLAISAAGLFGVSTPAAKAIVGDMSPLLLAGLLYLGSGVGLMAFRLTLREDGAAIRRADLPWLGGAILFGGGLGPTLLMWGLVKTTGSTASLLLTLEGVFTALIAWVVFREPFNRRIGIGMAVIFAGAVLLALRSPTGNVGTSGTFAVAGACLCWALDNNCTSRISHIDAPTLAMIKGLVAGSVNTVLGLVVGASLPPMLSVASAAVVGFLGYGISLVLFVLALREVGAARTGAYFSTAPFLGAILGIFALHEPVTLPLLLAGALMSIGVFLHLTEQPKSA
ncbi:DMT family transporter [soil metagenome]